MPDREKIIKALTECIFLHEHPDDDAGCFECPYRPEEKGTCPTMIPFLKDVLELLKEQEPVKPKANDEVIRVKYNCGVCGYLVGFVSTIHDDMQYQAKYCPECGRKVLWNG